VEILFNVASVYFDSSSTELHKSFGEVLEKIEHEHWHVHGGTGHTEAVITNGLFVHKDHPFKDSYVHSLRKYTFANATNLDFMEPTGATDEINS